MSPKKLTILLVFTLEGFIHFVSKFLNTLYLNSCFLYWQIYVVLRNLVRTIGNVFSVPISTYTVAMAQVAMVTVTIAQIAMVTVTMSQVAMDTVTKF